MRSPDAAALLRGELSGAEVAAGGRPPRGSESEYREHLSSCRICRTELEGLGEVLDALEEDRRRGEEAEPAPDLRGPILARLHARGALARPAGRRAAVAAVAATLLVAGLAVALMLGITEPSGDGGRPQGDQRQASLARAEGLAVAWFAGAQEPDGLWSAARWDGDRRYDVGLGGLGLLALLGALEADGGSPSLEDSARRAVEGLLREQAADGLFGPRFFAAPYNHGIATAALLEASGMRDDLEVRLRAPIERALSWIREHQDASGGWGYLDGDGANSSLTYWPLHALLVGRALGHPALTPAIERAFTWLASVSDDTGRIGYRRAGEHPEGEEVLLAKAIACDALRERWGGEPTALGRLRRDRLYRLLHERSAPAAARTYYGEFILLSAAYAGFSPPASGPAGPRSPGEDEALRGRLVAIAGEQDLDGDDRGSWAPSDRWSPLGGRVYATATATLTLQAGRRWQRLDELMR